MPKTKRQLDMSYGLGVGFDAAAVGSPFVRGHRQPEMTVSGGAFVRGRRNLSEDRAYGPRQRRLEKRFVGSDRLADWARERQPGGLVIHLRRGQRAARPLRLDVSLSGETVSRILLVAEAGARATVVLRRQGSGRAVALTEALLGAQARINLVKVQSMDDCRDFSRLQAELSESARLSVSECLFGGRYTASWADVVLNGPNAEFRSRTVVVATGQEKFDLQRRSRHRHPLTDTYLESANVLLEASQAVDHGRIGVDRGATGCSGTQKAATLLLGEKADFASQPILEIDEDDVVCAHASSIGTVDRERLFYLMSRGLNRASAERRLAEGFIAPVLAEMRQAGLDEMVNCLVASRFS